MRRDPGRRMAWGIDALLVEMESLFDARVKTAEKEQKSGRTLCANKSWLEKRLRAAGTNLGTEPVPACSKCAQPFPRTLVKSLIFRSSVECEDGTLPLS